jgi:hypothetical protein
MANKHIFKQEMIGQNKTFLISSFMISDSKIRIIYDSSVSISVPTLMPSNIPLGENEDCEPCLRVLEEQVEWHKQV